MGGLPTDELQMRKLFEESFGFVSYHQDKTNPFKTGTHHQVFDADRCLSAQIERLLVADVPTKANMNLDAILKLPLDLYTMLLNKVSEIAEKEAKLAEEAQEELDKAYESLGITKK